MALETEAKRSEDSRSALLDSLSIAALCQGQSVWFRVVSGSMRPCVQRGDAILIEPLSLHDLHTGDIAAFQTSDGLVVHRIAHILPSERSTRFIEMGDVSIRANQIAEEAIVGRVKTIRRGSRRIDLRKPLAQKVGNVTARLRYQLYSQHESSQFNAARLVFRKTARLFARIGGTVIRLTCASVDHSPIPFIEKVT